MARTITLEKKHSVDSLKSLNALFGDMDDLTEAINTGDTQRYIEIVSTDEGRDTLKHLDAGTQAKARALGDTVPSQHDTSGTSVPREQAGLCDLAKSYLSAAIQSLTRLPSPKLKPDFRATLNHWRQLTEMALKTADAEPQALVNVVMAVTQTEGTFDALRLIRNVAGQLLWQASVDVARDRRTQNQDATYERQFQDGEPNHVDSEYVAPPTEDEAIDAYTEAHAWLSSVADLLPNDEDDRARLGLDSGLEFCQRRVSLDDGTAEWHSVYSAAEALEIQLAKNEASMRKRDADKVLARKDAFAALAKIAA